MRRSVGQTEEPLAGGLSYEGNFKQTEGYWRGGEWGDGLTG